MTAVKALGGWRNNAEMIVDVAAMGYLDGDVLDPTWGLGRFWKEFTPDRLTASDLNPAKSPIGYPIDFTDLPFDDDSFDTVVLDGPYKLNGTTSGASDADYGVDVRGGWKERHTLIKQGMNEGARVARRYLLVKCQDQVCGGKVRWQTIEFANHGLEIGLELVTRFLLESYRPQPEGRRQVTPANNVSALLVFGVKS